MLNRIFDGETPLCPPKVRTFFFVGCAVFAFCALVITIKFNVLAVKIPALYLFVACIMTIIVAVKNSLNKYETGIFIFLCAQLLVLAPGPEEMESLVATSYLVSYRYGASSRSFIAAIVDFLAGGFISKYFVWHFIFCFTGFFNFLIAVYLGAVIQKSAGTVRPFVLFVSLLYLVCFTSPASYFVQANFGRVELFAFIFMLVMLAVLEKPVLCWIIPLLALFTLATHVILVFFYIPFIVIMLLYELLKKENRDRNDILLFAVTVCFVIGAFFLYILFRERTFVFQDAHSMAEYLKTKSDLGFTEGFLHLILFARLQDHFDHWKSVVTPLYRGNMSILINIPFLAAFVVFWVQCFRHETKKPIKFFFALPVLLLLYHAAAFFMFFDFGRWMIMIMNIQFMLLFYLLHTHNQTATITAEKTAPFIAGKRLYILAFIFIAFLGPVNQVGPSERVLRLAKVVFRIFGKSL
jgi:hypothetical protein